MSSVACHECRIPAYINWLVFLAVLALQLPGQLRAATPDCAAAAALAAERHAVPTDILKTIARIESGRDDGGWPWTVGHRGAGHWAASRREAAAHAQALIDRGERNIDLGCFQINLHWHSKSFRSLDDMLDPDRNADYAARLLAEHFTQTGNWEAAVAAYHSRTPEAAARYMERFRNAWRSAPPATPVTTPPVLRLALFDAAGVAPAAGSLVRPGGIGRSLIGGGP